MCHMFPNYVNNHTFKYDIMRYIIIIGESQFNCHKICSWI